MMTCDTLEQKTDEKTNFVFFKHKINFTFIHRQHFILHSVRHLYHLMYHLSKK